MLNIEKSSRKACKIQIFLVPLQTEFKVNPPIFF